MTEVTNIGLFGNRESVESLGQLGLALQKVLEGKEDINCFSLSNTNEGLPIELAEILIYCRKTSGQIREVLEHCEKGKVPLILASTGMDSELPVNPNFPLIKAPNLALDVVEKILEIERMSQNEYLGWTVKIVEHHQEGKTSIPGTAMEVAKRTGMDTENMKRLIVATPHAYEVAMEDPNTHVISVRYWEMSREMCGIPDENEGGYGIHEIIFTSPDGKETKTMKTEVFGREKYAEGAYQLIRALKKLGKEGELKAGIISIFDFVAQGLHKAGLNELDAEQN